MPIAKELSEDLIAWRRVSQQQYDGKKKKHGLPPSEPEAFMFPNRDGSFMDPSNYRKRVLHKLATELGLPKEGVRATVDSIHHELKGTMKKLAAKAGIRAPAAATRAAMVS